MTEQQIREKQWWGSCITSRSWQINVGQWLSNILSSVVCESSSVHGASDFGIQNVYLWAEEEFTCPSFLYALAALPEVLSRRIYLERTVFFCFCHTRVTITKLPKFHLRTNSWLPCVHVSPKCPGYFHSGPLRSRGAVGGFTGQVSLLNTSSCIWHLHWLWVFM